MVKIDTKNNKSPGAGTSYLFPESEKITIDKANLQIQLDKFKSAVTRLFNFETFVSLLITLSAVWVPLFTADFKSILGLSSIMVKSIYTGFSSLVTLYAFYRYILKPVYFFFFEKNNVSNDPEEMAQIILDKCNKK